jgi:hypothetical protein
VRGLTRLAKTNAGQFDRAWDQLATAGRLCPSPCWCPSRERKQEYGECYQKRSECRA